ncbi:VWA domain-containing protein [Gemmata obscuriglobus]|nr:VWA domain-containing protein [Gemmata obscuriglobus]
MRASARTTRTALRRAVWASVTLHAVAASGLIVLVRTREVEPPKPPPIDTRASYVQMHLAETIGEVEVRPDPPTPTPAAPAAKPPAAKLPETAPEPPPVAGPAGPFTPAVPHTLPPELVALIRKPPAGPTVGAVPDPNVKPAGAIAAAAPVSTGRVLHGAFKPAQTVVYLIDCSGSMGAAGKSAAARSALLATLARQPATVRFQVIAYDSTPRALVSGGTVLATPENIQAASARLDRAEPRGSSKHLIALRAALDLRPDVVVWLTDADDLTGAAIRPVLKASGRPVPVCVGLVTATGVQQLRELK